MTISSFTVSTGFSAGFSGLEGGRLIFDFFRFFIDIYLNFSINLKAGFPIQNSMRILKIIGFLFYLKKTGKIRKNFPHQMTQNSPTESFELSRKFQALKESLGT